jgi:hypothetical protein
LSTAPHHFIFSPGVWEGAGTITFSMAEDVLPFTMRWTILPMEDQKIYFNQEIAIKSFPEKMRNQFTLWNLSATAFELQLENQIVGKVKGSGLITPKAIAWEFRRKDQEFEGYEIYELQKDGSYKMHAEFTAGEGMRTHVTGSISLSPHTLR